MFGKQYLRILLFAATGLSTGAALAKNIECKFSGAKGAPQTQEEWRIFFLHKNSEVFKTADRNCDGKLSQDEVDAYTSSENTKIELALNDVARRRAAGKQVQITEDGETIPAVLGDTEPGKPLPAGWNFLLRDSFEDVTLFTHPKSAKNAAGAQFSWSRDGISKNSVWSAKGVLSVGYSQLLEPPQDPFKSYVVGYAFAPAISFNRVANSVSKKNDADVLGFSATSELGIGNFLGGTQYLRARPALITDFDGKSKSWSMTAEWQPLVINENLPSLSVPNGLGPVTWEFDPILRLQYAHELNDSGGPLFDTDKDPLRLGPVLALTIAPKQNDEIVPKWLQPASLFSTYEWLTDVNTGDATALFTAGLKFNLDEDGHTAFKVSYEDGHLEETGEHVKQISVGMTATW